MKDIQSQIREKIAVSRFTKFSKLFLFGITGKDCIPALRHEQDQAGTQIRPETKEEIKNTCEDIGRKISGWTASGMNYLSDFSLDDLSGEIGIPAHELAKYFRRHIRKDFREWKADLRIEKAKSMILEESDSTGIEGIGYAVGFRDKSNFHRQFKRRTGCTPGQWRQCGGHTELLD